MWIAPLATKNGCLIGNKCEQYKVSTVCVPFTLCIEKDTTHSPEFYTIGARRSITRIIAALRKDKHLNGLIEWLAREHQVY